MRAPLVLVIALLAAAVLAPPLHAETLTYDRQYSFSAAAGGKLTADVSFSDLVVSVREGDQVAVKVTMKVTGNEDKAQKFLDENAPEVRQEGNEVVITTPPHRSGWGSWWKSGRLRTESMIEVSLPPGMNVDLETASGDCRVEGDLGPARLRCETASGDVVLKGSAREAALETASGDVEVTAARPLETLSASTASGDIEVEAEAGEIRLDSASGDIDFTGGAERTSLDAASGDITGRWTSLAAGARIEADTASGDVSLRLPPGCVLDGKISTGSGDIHSDFDGNWSRDRDGLTFPGAADAVLIKASTASGDVTLRAGGK